MIWVLWKHRLRNIRFHSSVLRARPDTSNYNKPQHRARGPITIIRSLFCHITRTRAYLYYPIHVYNYTVASTRFCFIIITYICVHPYDIILYTYVRRGRIWCALLGQCIFILSSRGHGIPSKNGKLFNNNTLRVRSARIRYHCNHSVCCAGDLYRDLYATGSFTAVYISPL